ncbi:MAG: glycosyltransferase family 1 protein [Myxococcales bacterium]|nr:glycosyltransferase family 4 protein [Polyangiaceae bacterium]MDW8248031.1 glycosyltransferase family 1 protein [Myxococcales bacterium]
MAILDVLLDLTPLDTPSRLRGIGHYVAYLGAAMATLTPSEKQGLDIRGLVSLSGEIVGPLQWSGTDPMPYPVGQGMRYIWDRRFKLTASLLSLRPRPRLLHVTQNLGTPWGSLVPRVITCHDMIRLVLHEQYVKASRAYLEAFRLAELARFSLARRVIAVSRYTADDLMRVLKVPSSRIDVVHHGVDTKRFRPPSSPDEEALHREQRRALGIDQKPYFLYVGAVDPRKKAELLVSAFVRARIPDVDLVFAGWLTDDEQQRLQGIWRAEGGTNPLRFLGFVEDDLMNALMHGALGLVFPSIYEGFGMPVLEAMAAGCPVITTSATSLGEVAGDAALLIPGNDRSALQDTLVRLVTDNVLRRQLREAGLARAQQFTWKNTALGTVDSYAKALRA